ncbi:hypothetical protein U3A55_06345 [Salarchaeum sp. III]|uniref:hypothetical protein n=1 Tax=Salarchaeum sp. III TaxID=3107927 RepID=UPI002ED98701
MAATGRTASFESAALAERVRDAAFVYAVAHADGDSLAAAGQLARACDALGTPYQVSLTRSREGARSRVASVAASDTALAIGVDAGEDAQPLDTDDPLALAAYAVADRLAPESADPELALAGAVSAGWTPQGDLLDAAAVSRRPGVGIPVADLADGLAHSTRLSGPFSGDEGMAGALLAELGLPADLDADAHRRLASRVALDVTDDAPASAADALSRVLRPYVVADGSFETIEGYADVLDAVARTAPGVGAAFALGRGDRADTLDAWREAASTVHAALAASEPKRYSGLVTVDAGDADPWLVARLARDFHSTEPAVLATADESAALATTGTDARRVLAAVVGADYVGGRDTLAASTRLIDNLAETVRGEL